MTRAIGAAVLLVKHAGEVNVHVLGTDGEARAEGDLDTTLGQV
jgi:hypothetical protein